MSLTYLGRGGSGLNDCPTLYATDWGTYIAQGWVTDDPGTIEIPQLLLGFLVPDTFIGATLTDTGRGTFFVSGRPITDAETLSRLTLADDETAIEIPQTKREFYGHATADRQSVA